MDPLGYETTKLNQNMGHFLQNMSQGYKKKTTPFHSCMVIYILLDSHQFMFLFNNIPKPIITEVMIETINPLSNIIQPTRTTTHVI